MKAVWAGGIGNPKQAWTHSMKRPQKGCFNKNQ